MKINFTAIKTAGQEGGSVILDRVIDFIAQAFKRLGDVVVNDKLIPASFPAAGVDVSVAHGLGHAFTSVEVVRRDADVNVWESPTDNAAPDRLVILRANAAATVTLRIS